MTYPGGKNGGGVYQRIINHMPPHSVYIEPFLGSGAVLRNKRPAERNIGIDINRKAAELCEDLISEESRHQFSFYHSDAVEMMEILMALLDDMRLTDLPDTLIYADPPYVMSTRKGGDLYEHEMDDKAHKWLLDYLKSARCMVMISGYRSKLYDDALTDFHRVDYMANTRRGMVPESLWMNFPPPIALHDYSHLGGNYRERERIKRKKARWAAKIEGMDRQERLAIMDVLTASKTSIN